MPERTRVEDITTLKSGDVIQVNLENGKTDMMTVKIPFDKPKEGRFALSPGVQCTVHANARVPAHDILIGELLPRHAVIFLVEGPVAELARDVDAALDDLELDHMKRLMEE